MAFRLRWAGSGVFLATEIRVQLHEWLAILTGTLTPGALIVFVAILAPELLPVTLVGALVYSMFLIGQRVLNEAAYIRIDHKLNELYHASPLSPESYFVGLAGGMLVAYLPPSLVLLGILQVLHPLDTVAGLTLIVCLLAVWAVSSTIGYVVSTLFKDMKTIWPYSALLTNLFGVVPPVFYRLGSVPVGWRSVALLLPTSAAAVLVDAAAGLESLTRTEATVAAVALAAEALVLFAFGIYWARRTAREP
ncbi:MAG: ABC transporter permease [Methanobacteriota archaeon]|nr:MAG: ABC transporter permease [Euryarchaeota archaeon]